LVKIVWKRMYTGKKRKTAISETIIEPEANEVAKRVG
jgi:hypothetical protein